MALLRLLDLFCCAGGAGMGYHRAGLEVTGVDIVPRPRYPFEFMLADALSLDPAWIADTFDAVHASPPCQAFSVLKHRHPDVEHPDLLDGTRELLRATGLPFIIENVEGAPLLDPVMLCGTMFPGLKVLRHRLFESNVPLVRPVLHPLHPKVRNYDKRKPHYGQRLDFVTVAGGCIGHKEAQAAMGIDWMKGRAEVTQAIPPAYTEFLGRQLVAHIEAARAAA